MSQMRINIDNLEWNDHIHYFQGKPFFGVGFELFASGALRTETEYEYGMEHGKSREWYENGQLLSEDFYQYGTRHGIGKTFFENGRRKSSSEYELGILLKDTVWDGAGKILKDFTLQSTDRNYELLLLNRKNQHARERMIKEKLGKI